MLFSVRALSLANVPPGELVVPHTAQSTRSDFSGACIGLPHFIQLKFIDFIINTFLYEYMPVFQE